MKSSGANRYKSERFTNVNDHEDNFYEGGRIEGHGKVDVSKGKKRDEKGV